MARDLGRYLTYLLRHHPEDAQLTMDLHGYVPVGQLIENLRLQGREIDSGILDDIVARDGKQRFRFSQDRQCVKACQGHTIPWVIPELSYPEPPKKLYHGTSLLSWPKIQATGAILRMERHAVHMRADPARAWQSGERWHQGAVLLEIDAAAMMRDGFSIGVTDNDVWCTEIVPLQYILNAYQR